MTFRKSSSLNSLKSSSFWKFRCSAAQGHLPENIHKGCTSSHTDVPVPTCDQCEVFHLDVKLTTLMAARGKKHLKIMFAVLPPFKLQMEKNQSVRGMRSMPLT